MTQERPFLTGRVPLDCVIFPGMFSTERQIVLKIEETEYVMYADEQFLTITEESEEGGGKKGKVWVKVRRHLPNAYVVALPEETLSSGELITVPKSMVREAL